MASLPAAVGDAVVAAEPLRHAQSNAAIGGIWRVKGSAGSAVLKLATPAAPETAHAVWPTSDEPAHWNYWRRESLAYETGLAATAYRGEVTAPEVLQVSPRPDGKVELWLADVGGAGGFDWPVPRLARFAYELGAGQARWAGRVPDTPWLSRRWLAQYLAAGPSRLVRVDAADWDHPNVAATWRAELRPPGGGHVGVVPVGGVDAHEPARPGGEVLRQPAAGQPGGIRHPAGPPGLPGTELVGKTSQARNRPVEAARAADVGKPQFDLAIRARAHLEHLRRGDLAAVGGGGKAGFVGQALPSPVVPVSGLVAGRPHRVGRLGGRWRGQLEDGRARRTLDPPDPADSGVALRVPQRLGCHDRVADGGGQARHDRSIAEIHDRNRSGGSPAKNQPAA